MIISALSALIQRSRIRLASLEEVQRPDPPLEFCNPYRGWTENPDLRRRFLGGDNALEKIDQAFASKKVKEWQESWSYPGD